MPWAGNGAIIMNLNVALEFVSGNTETETDGLGKRNSLFPTGPVIKSYMLTCYTMYTFQTFA